MLNLLRAQTHAAVSCNRVCKKRFSTAKRLCCSSRTIITMAEIDVRKTIGFQKWAAFVAEFERLRDIILASKEVERTLLSRAGKLCASYAALAPGCLFTMRLAAYVDMLLSASNCIM
jgi:hypothetical protein